ncbi:MAG: translation initiation factor, partial [Nitrososphaerota archaeon]|nr:translation initiation factor [Nitrososphaerota archaeon]
MEMRRFGKPTTVIEGIKMSDKDLHGLNSKMKRALATGGTVKDGI